MEPYETYAEVIFFFAVLGLFCLASVIILLGKDFIKWLKRSLNKR